MVFLMVFFFNYAKSPFSLKGFDFSHCMSARCDHREDHSISSRLGLLGVHPKGSPAIAPISAAPRKTWQAFLSVFLSRRVFYHSPVPTSHHNQEVLHFSLSCRRSGQMQTQDLLSLLQWFHPNPFAPPHHMPLEAQPLFLNFLSPDKFPRPFSSLSLAGKGYRLHSNSHYTDCDTCPTVWFPTWLGNHV